MSLITTLFIILAAIGAIGISIFQYYYKNKQRNSVNILLVALRSLAVFSLLLLLINPKFKSQQITDIPPQLNVVIDNSSSIGYMNQEDQVIKFVDELKNNAAINNKFTVNYFALADDLQQQETFSFDKPATNISKTLRTLASFNKDNVAPTVLVTDGNQTYGSTYEFYRSKQQIYPLVVGDTLSYDDLKINQINTNSYTNLNNKFPVEIFLEYQGNKAIKKMVNIKHLNKVIYKKQIEFSNKHNSHRLQFHLPATTIGKQNYTCTVDAITNEKNKLNNIKNFNVEVIDEHANILVLSAMNHPDISMIKRSIETNKQRKVTIINDLNKDFLLNEYQLVIIYQPTKEFKNIFNRIKDNNLNFFVITGTKTEWNYLNTSQDYFSKKSTNLTEITSAEFNANYDEFIIEDIGFSNLPPLQGYFGGVSFSSPFRSILYQNISNYTTENPLLATFTNNRRRGAVLFGENIWKWRMLIYKDHQSFEKFDTFFNKLIQYLSLNKYASQLEIEYKPFVFNNSAIIIEAQFFDANYSFDGTANLTLSLTNKSTKQTNSYPFALKNNKYEVVLNNLIPGDYNFRVKADKHIVSKGGNFTVSNYSIEQQFVRANVSHLTKLANASGGKLLHLSDANKLFANLLSDKRYMTVQKSTERVIPLIDWKWLLGLIILFFSLEWFIRKYIGLI